jgi:hypothetical protein
MFRGRKCTHKHSEEGSACARVLRKEVHKQAFRGERFTVHTHALIGWRCTHMRSEEGGARTCAQRREVHTHALRGGRCTQRALRTEVNASATTKRRECTHMHSEQGAARIRPQKSQMYNEGGLVKHLYNKCRATRKEVQHMSRGRRCNLCLMMRYSWVSVYEIYSRVWMRSSRLVDEI